MQLSKWPRFASAILPGLLPFKKCTTWLFTFSPFVVSREGLTRTSFNYLLLDPRETRNLPSKHLTLGESESWNIFLRAIFYVGKGTRSRPFQHLYEAVKKADSQNVNVLYKWKKILQIFLDFWFQVKLQGRVNRLSEKTKKILDIWSSGTGVISLQVNVASI